MENKNRKKYCFDVLDLKEGATIQEIKKKYRKLAKKYHPDLNKNDPNASERFLELQNAYDYLLNPECEKKNSENKKSRIWKPLNDLFEKNQVNRIKHPQAFINNHYHPGYNTPEPFLDIRELIKQKHASEKNVITLDPLDELFNTFENRFYRILKKFL
ncbi:MAG: J domain-containing protein [Promethearchaeota archaeon]